VGAREPGRGGVKVYSVKQYVRAKRSYFRTRLVMQRRKIMDAWAEYCGRA
jgi:hypothetical protein